MNGFNLQGPFTAPQAQPVAPQGGADWWNRATNAVGGSSTPSKGMDYNMWGSILGRGAQAFSAQDPTSWQHQLGGLGAQIGQSRKMALAAEAEKKRRSALNSAVLKAFGIDVPALGEGAEPKKKSQLDFEGAREDREISDLMSMSYLNPAGGSNVLF